MESERYARVLAAVRCEQPDRIPWGVWGHFPSLSFLKYYSWEKANRDGEELARAHVALLNELDYTMDLLKVTPFYRFMAYHWGSRFQFINNEEDPEMVDVAVKRTEDWKQLWVLDPKKELREYVRAISILSREIGRRMSFIFTLPSPLVIAVNQISTPERVYADMKAQPCALKEGLETVTQTCIDYGRACMDEGATGVFYGLGGGGNVWSRMNRNQLEEYGLYYDNKVLAALKDAPIRLLHVCCRKDQEDPQTNGGLMESGWFRQYGVNAINWWDARFTSLLVAKKIYGDKFCVVGGIDQEGAMRTGTPERVEDQVKAAIESAGEGGGLVIGPGCTVFQDTPIENFNAVGRAVDKYGRYRR